jgi:hypothetical protein
LAPALARRLFCRHAIQSIFDMFKIGPLGVLLDWIRRRFSGSNLTDRVSVSGNGPQSLIDHPGQE